MWRNYLTVGFRALAKNRTYALINILGLAIGLAACLLILLFVRYETGYDEWLPGAENTYLLETHYTKPREGDPFLLQMTSYASGVAAVKDFPQIEKSVYAMRSEPILLRKGEAETLKGFLFVTGEFFDVVRMPFVAGDPRTALSPGNNLVLTESEAKRLFPGEQALGKTVTIAARGFNYDYRVTGIVRDPPKDSHMNFKIVARFDIQNYFSEQPDFLTAWGNQSGWFYVRLRPGTDPQAIRDAFPAWEKRNIPDENIGTERYNQGEEADFDLVNVRDLHLDKAQGGAMKPGNDMRSIVTFAVIGVLILGMACVNFVNLSTARAGQRAREVALRKVLGADRRQLITQFLTESVLVAAIAMVLALAIVELVLPPLSSFLDADLTLHFVGKEGLLVPAILLVLVVGGAGGLYPAFFLSRFQPATVLKANKSSSEPHGSGRLRGALVVGQFAVSIGLIICTAIVYGQTVYARSFDPGYKRDGIIQVESIGRRQIYDRQQAIKDEIRRVPGVTAVGITSIGIATGNNSNNFVQLPDSEKTTTLGNYQVDEGFFAAMGLKTIAGRTFDRNRPMDDSNTPFPIKPEAERAMAARGMNVVVNEFATRRLGFRNPADAVGKVIRSTALGEEYGLVPMTIIGVVGDAHFRSIREPLDPIVFRMQALGANWMIVRYQNADPRTVNAAVEAAWKRIAPEVPYEAKFSEDVIGELYETEDARAQIFAGFALLSVIVGCLGLFGLAAFTAERRTKEIGIRKVLGARTRDIVRLLVWQFTRPVLIANLIAWPIAWWVMRDWLNGFDMRMSLTPMPFVAAAVLALGIAVATIAGHAWRVARENPIRALRYE